MLKTDDLSEVATGHHNLEEQEFQFAEKFLIAGHAEGEVLESLENLLDEHLNGLLIEGLDGELNEHNRAVHVAIGVLSAAHRLPTEVDEVQLHLVLTGRAAQEAEAKLLDQLKLVVDAVNKVLLDRKTDDGHGNRDDLCREVADD